MTSVTGRPAPSAAGPIAFVLPGGATWGAVQVGMLAALTDAGIRADLLVGTSVGALNAAMFAAAPHAPGVEALAAAWCSARRSRIFPVGPGALVRAARRRGHLLDPRGLHRWIAEHVGFERLEDAGVPLHVMATDAAARRPVVLSSGDAVTALLASCAIPAVFPPVTVDGRALIDGGVAADHPVPQARDLGAAVVFELSTYGRPPPGRPSVRGRTLDALDRRFGRPPGPPAGPAAPAADAPPAGRAEPTVVHVLPAPPTTDVNPFSFGQSRRLIAEAEALTRAWLADHRPLVDLLTPRPCPTPPPGAPADRAGPDGGCATGTTG